MIQINLNMVYSHMTLLFFITVIKELWRFLIWKSSHVYSFNLILIWTDNSCCLSKPYGLKICFPRSSGQVSVALFVPASQCREIYSRRQRSSCYCHPLLRAVTERLIWGLSFCYSDNSLSLLNIVSNHEISSGRWRKEIHIAQKYYTLLACPLFHIRYDNLCSNTSSAGYACLLSAHCTLFLLQRVTKQTIAFCLHCVLQ